MPLCGNKYMRIILRIILMTILLFETSIIGGIYCIDTSHLKSFTIQGINKDNQNTKTYDPPSIQPGSSHPTGELAADTTLSAYSGQGEEFLNGNSLSEDSPVVPSPSDVCLAFINASAVLITWDPSPLTVSPVQFVVQVSHDGDPYKNTSHLLNVTHFVYTGMKYSAYYQFRVIAYQKGVASEAAETNYFLNGLTAPPGPPVNVVASVESYSVINLQWDAPLTPSPLIYLVYWGTNETEFDHYEPVTQGTHTSFNDLEPGQTYVFYIVADIGSWKSIPSITVNATTLPPSLPAVVLKGMVSSTWIQLSWTDPPSNRYPLSVDEFHVYYKHLSGLELATESLIEPDNFTNIITVNGNERSVNISGLKSGNYFLFSVAYTSGHLLSDLSKGLILDTLERVLCIACEPVSSSELMLHWQVLTNLTRSRVLDVFAVMDGLGPDQLLILKVNVNSTDGYLVVDNLHPWKGYLFAVSLETTLGDPSMNDLCPILDCWTKQAAPSKPPCHITVSRVTSRSISLGWTQPLLNAQNGLITSYTIVYLCNPRTVQQVCDTKQIKVSADRPSNLTLTLNHLTPFTEYSYVIAASTRVGIGPFSFKQTVVTDTEAPDSPPVNVTVTDVTDNLSSLTWCPPPLEHRNGIIIGYSISVTSLTRPLMGIPNQSVTSVNPDTGFTNVSNGALLNVNDTKVVINRLLPSTTYMVAIAARTKAGLGPYSLPVTMTTLEPNVSKLGSSINFSISIVSQPKHEDCLILEVYWGQIITVNDTVAQLNTSSVYALDWNYTVYYESTSGAISGNITVGDNPLGTNLTLLLSSESSNMTLMAGLNYSLWMQADIYLSNKTHLEMSSEKSLIPLSPCESFSGRSVSWEIVVLSCVGTVLVIGAAIVLTVCCGCCWHRWFKPHRTSMQAGFLMDNFVPPEVEENDYLLDPSLRVSDGQSSVSDSTEEERVRMSSESIRSGSEDSILLDLTDNDPDVMRVIDETHPWIAITPSLRSGASSPRVGMPVSSPWPRNGNGNNQNLDSRMAEWLPPSVLPLAPRQNPDGCSLSVSSSESISPAPSSSNSITEFL